MAEIPSLTAEARQRLQTAVTTREDREAVCDALGWLDTAETALMAVDKAD